MAECPTCGETYKNEAGMKIHHKRIHGESISGVLSECEVCGEEFRHDPLDAGRFCDFDCYAEWQSQTKMGEGRDRVNLTCEVCGDTFEVIRSRKDDARFCSYECMGEWQSEARCGEDHPRYVEEVEVECDWCGNPLTRLPSYVDMYEHVFCGHECYAEYMSEYRVGEDHPLWKPDSNPQYGPGWNEKKKERVRERDNRECQVCGDESSGEKLNVHHIQQARTFDDPEKRNAMENLIALCRACHQRVEKFAPLLPQT